MRDLGALAGGVSEANGSERRRRGGGLEHGCCPGRSAPRCAGQDGVKKNLGTLGGRNSRATDINEDGVIVGWSNISSGDTHAFVYQNGVMKDIGTLGGKAARAFGINKAGRVVGSSTTASGKTHAFACARRQVPGPRR